jgi:hypothetical protein
MILELLCIFVLGLLIAGFAAFLSCDSQVKVEIINGEKTTQYKNECYLLKKAEVSIHEK